MSLSVEGVYVLNSEGAVLLHRTWGSGGGPAPGAFNSMKSSLAGRTRLQTCRRGQGRDCPDPEPPHLVSTENGGCVVTVTRHPLHYVAVVQDGPPLLAAEMLSKLALALTELCGASSGPVPRSLLGEPCHPEGSWFTPLVGEAELKATYTKAYLLVEELFDSGGIFTSDLNCLGQLHSAHTPMTSLVTTMGGSEVGGWLQSFKSMVQGGPSRAFANGENSFGVGLSSELWWRRPSDYVTNEIYVDVVEKVDCVVSAKGKVVAGAVVGQIRLNSRLSGQPEVLLTVKDPSALKSSQFHPCVRAERWLRDRHLSFTPPDGQFVLVKYLLQHDPSTGIEVRLPVSVECKFQCSPTEGLLSLRVSPRISCLMGARKVGPPQDQQCLVEGVRLRVRLPLGVQSASITNSKGREGAIDQRLSCFRECYVRQRHLELGLVRGLVER
jgi:hypothetical protein